MLVRDEDARQLQTAAEKTGIAKKLKKKAGLSWYALKPLGETFLKTPYISQNIRSSFS